MNNLDPLEIPPDAYVTSIKDKRTGELKFYMSSTALVIEITYTLAENKTDPNTGFTLEGTVNHEGFTRTYEMPNDDYIMNLLKNIPSDQVRQIKFDYQVVLLPTDKTAVAEISQTSGQARIFEEHHVIDQIFLDIGLYLLGDEIKPQAQFDSHDTSTLSSKRK